MTNVTSLDSLKGTTVLAHSIYLKHLEDINGIKASALDWTGESTWKDVTGQLKSGSILAYIVDIVYLEFNLGEEACTFGFVGGLINPFNYGFAFAPQFNDSLLQDFNGGIMEVQVCPATHDSTFISRIYINSSIAYKKIECLQPPCPALSLDDTYVCLCMGLDS